MEDKELASGLEALDRVRGRKSAFGDISVVKSAGTIVENNTTPATVNEELEDESQATPAKTPENVDGRGSAAWKELKQYHDRTVYELREKIKNLENSLAQSSVVKVQAPKTAEEMKAFKEHYGDVVDYMRTLVIEELQNDNLQADLRSKLNDVVQSQRELKEREAFAKLLEEHPDAAQIKEDPKFAAWYNEQPDDIKRIFATSTDYKAISKQLTLYKLEVLGVNPAEKKKIKQQSNVDASMDVSIKRPETISPAKKVWTLSEIRALSKDYKKWSKYKDEIDIARRENRVDLTK
jgi:hypothetical protein